MYNTDFKLVWLFLERIWLSTVLVLNEAIEPNSKWWCRLSEHWPNDFDRSDFKLSLIEWFELLSPSSLTDRINDLTAWLRGQRSHFSCYRLHSKALYGRTVVVASYFPFARWLTRMMGITNYNELSSWCSTFLWHAISGLAEENEF